MQKIERKPAFHISPLDAKKIGVRDGNVLKVKSTVDKLQAAFLADENMPLGIINASRHSPKPFLNGLSLLEFDESLTPNYKATAVQIRKIHAEHG